MVLITIDNIKKIFYHGYILDLTSRSVYFKMLYNFYLKWLNTSIYPYLNIPLHLRLKVKEKENIGIKDEKPILFYMILTWSIVYCIYKECLIVYLRKLGYGAMRRNYFAKTLWNLGFTSFIILYITLLWNFIFESVISFLILKSFYIHYFGILIFENKKFKGFQTFLLIMFIFGIPRRSIQPPVSSLLLVKSIEVLFLYICQFMFLKNIKKNYTKIFFLTYFIFWMYLYMVYVPTNILLPYTEMDENLIDEKILIWLWFLFQCVEVVWFKFFINFKSLNYMELCLFQTKKSVESQYLINLFNKYHKLEKIQAKDKNTLKKEHWQLLFGAMTLKRKLKRIRKLKEANKKNLTEQEPVIESEKTK